MYLCIKTVHAVCYKIKKNCKQNTVCILLFDCETFFHTNQLVSLLGTGFLELYPWSLKTAKILSNCKQPVHFRVNTLKSRCLLEHLTEKYKFFYSVQYCTIRHTFCYQAFGNVALIWISSFCDICMSAVYWANRASDLYLGSPGPQIFLQAVGFKDRALDLGPSFTCISCFRSPGFPFLLSDSCVVLFLRLFLKLYDPGVKKKNFYWKVLSNEQEQRWKVASTDRSSFEQWSPRIL